MQAHFLRAIAIALGIGVASCGGDDFSERPADSIVYAQAVGLEGTDVLFSFNYWRDDAITGWDAVRKVATDLDQRGIRFQLLECGLYGSDPIQGESGGYIWAPIGILVRVNATDLDLALSLGATEGIPAGTYIRDSRFCGDISLALAIPRRVFAWASSKYPEHFPHYTEAVFSWDGFTYAYFAATGNYIGVKNGRVYIHNGRDWTFLDVGTVTDFLPTATSDTQLTSTRAAQ
jgi:hypothetical protein